MVFEAMTTEQSFPKLSQTSRVKSMKRFRNFRPALRPHRIAEKAGGMS
jgi:hypothetical protein